MSHQITYGIAGMGDYYASCRSACGHFVHVANVSVNLLTGTATEARYTCPRGHWEGADPVAIDMLSMAMLARLGRVLRDEVCQHEAICCDSVRVA